MEPTTSAFWQAEEVVVVGSRVRGGRQRASRLSVLLAGMVTVAFGMLSAYHYVWGYWLYRGFPPPRLPGQVAVDASTSSKDAAARAGGETRSLAAVPVLPGSLETIKVPSPVPGVIEPVLVYLPPGYRTSRTRRYPALYLLHGVPGTPLQFADVGDVQVNEALLVARRQMGPMVIVMPQGGANLWDDTEWVNGVHRQQSWMSYVATTVVQAVDRKFRVVTDRSGRAIGGLSEGGYGALNIALHYPGEFSMVESWSGYTAADTDPRYFAGNARLLADNTVTVEVHREHKLLRRDHMYFWFYCAHSDPDYAQNAELSRELTKLHLPHKFFATGGYHDWGVWRPVVPAALQAAAAHIGARVAT